MECSYHIPFLATTGGQLDGQGLQGQRVVCCCRRRRRRSEACCRRWQGGWVWHLPGDLHQDGPSELQPCHVHQLLPRLVLLPVALAYPFGGVLFKQQYIWLSLDRYQLGPQYHTPPLKKFASGLNRLNVMSILKIRFEETSKHWRSLELLIAQGWFSNDFLKLLCGLLLLTHCWWGVGRGWLNNPS